MIARNPSSLRVQTPAHSTRRGRAYFLIWLFLALTWGSAVQAQAEEPLVISGAVQGEDKAPLAGVQIELHRTLDTFQERQRKWQGLEHEASASARTDRDGEYQIEVPEPGAWHIVAKAAGYAERALQHSSALILRSQRLADTQMLPARDLTIRVEDEDGHAVENAQVLAVALSKQRARFMASAPTNHSGRTDADGTLVFQVPEKTSVSLSVAHPDYSFHKSKDIEGDRTSVRLTTGQRQTLLVVDAEGTPLPGALVTLGGGLAIAEADEFGKAVVSRGGDEDVLGARTTKLVGTLELDTAVGESDTKLVLSPPETLSLVVLEDAGRKPIEGAWVYSQDAARSARTGVDGTANVEFAQPTGDASKVNAGAYAPGFFGRMQKADIQEETTILLKRGVTLRGRIVDSQGGSVRGVSIRVAKGGTQGFFRRDQDVHAVTSRDGRFEASPLDAEGGLVLHAQKKGFARHTEDLAAPEQGKDPKDLTIELLAGRTAWGTVVDEGDVPVAGAEVTFVKQSESSGVEAMLAQQFSKLEPTTSMTDRDGRFRFEDLAPGSYDLAAKASGFAPARIPSVPMPQQDMEVEVGTIALSPGVEVLGRVVDTDDVPIQGAKITGVSSGSQMAFVSFGMDDSEDEPDALSDAAGNFTLYDLADGSTVDISVKADGYGPGSLPGTRAPGLDPVTITLQAAVTVTGIVVDADGKGVPQARVSFNAEQGSTASGNFRAMMAMRRSETAEEDGTFVIQDVVPGRYRLVASSEDYQEAEKPGVEIVAGEDPDPLTLQLKRGAVLTGRVTDANGRPLAEARVQLVNKKRNFMRMTSGSFRMARTDADGDFELKGLPPGTSSFEASHAEHQTQTLDVDLQETGSRLDFRLDEGLTISGRVTGPNGTTVGGALIQAVQPTGAINIRMGGRDGSVATKEDGTFTLKGLSNGSYRVTANKTGFAAASTEDNVVLEGRDATGVELILGTGAALTGTISGLEFDQLASVQIMAVSRDGSSSEPLVGKATYEGTYRLDNLTAGNWMIMASVGQGGRSIRESVTIDPGTHETVLDLEFGGGVTVTGKVVGPEGPRAGVTLFAAGKNTASGAQAVSDQDGRFTLEGLKEDTYEIATLGTSGVSSQKEIEVTGDTDVLIELKSFRVTGRVTGQDGQPIEGAVISRNSLDAESNFFSFGEEPVSDATGSFAVDSLPPGPFRIQAQKEGFASAHADVEIAEADVSGIEIVLERSAGLRLTVRTPNGARVEQISAVAVDASENPVVNGSFRAGEDGFHIESLPQGSWRLYIQAPGSAALGIDVQVPSEPLDVVLPPGGGLRVRVTELIGTSSTAKMRIKDSEGKPYAVPQFYRLQSEWQIFDGQVSTEAIPEGIWTLEVESSDGERKWSTTTQVIAGTVLEVDIQ